MGEPRRRNASYRLRFFLKKIIRIFILLSNDKQGRKNHKESPKLIPDPSKLRSLGDGASCDFHHAVI